MSTKVKRVIHVNPPQVRYEKEELIEKPERKAALETNKLKIKVSSLVTGEHSPFYLNRGIKVSPRMPVKFSYNTKSILDLSNNKLSTPDNRIYFCHNSSTKSNGRLPRHFSNQRFTKFSGNYPLIKRKKIEYIKVKPLNFETRQYITPIRMELISAIKNSIIQHNSRILSNV